MPLTRSAATRSSPSAMCMGRGATPSKNAPTASRLRTWIIAKCCSKEIDAVFIASPDHWHVRMAVDALAAGKDVYLEKPVTHTIEEGATLTHAVRSGKRILQCGMQQRSWSHFRDAVELIQGGSLGRVAAGQDVLVAELSGWRAGQADRHAGARLEAVARRRAGSAVQRRKVLPLALVLELWRRRDDRSVHALDRRGALGDEIGPAARRADARRQIYLRASGIVPTRCRRLSAIRGSMSCTRA